MKKLVLTFVAIGLFFTGIHAQVVEVTGVPEIEAGTEVTNVEDDFEPIELWELPEAVSEAISRDYAGATTQEAWVKEKDGKSIYKIKLDVNGNEQKLYADAQGNWIDKDKMKDKKKDTE